MLEEKKSWIRLLFAGGRRTRGFLLLPPVAALLELERSRECSDTRMLLRLWWLLRWWFGGGRGDRGCEVALAFVTIVFGVTMGFGLGPRVSWMDDILRFGTDLRFCRAIIVEAASMVRRETEREQSKQASSPCKSTR